MKMALVSKETLENVNGFMQLLFGLDHEKPIKDRIDYEQDFFFHHRRMSEFCLSVWHQMLTKGFVTEKQYAVIQKFIKTDYRDVVSCFRSISAGILVAKAGYGNVEGQKIAEKYYKEVDEAKENERKENLKIFFKQKNIKRTE